MADTVRNATALDYTGLNGSGLPSLKQRLELLAKTPTTEYDKRAVTQLIDDLEFMASIWMLQAQTFRRMPSSRVRRFLYADFSDIADTYEINSRSLTALVNRFRAGL